VTIQPAGALFNPPAPITIPNVDGLMPGHVTEMYSFDHDIGSFVAIGTGAVSADGSIIRSDPGVGVIKAGWHCGGNPAANGTVADCPDCKWCQGNTCVTDPAQNCKCCGTNTGVCQGGACNSVGGSACGTNSAVVPTVTNLGNWPGCTPLGLTRVDMPQNGPTVVACNGGSCVWNFRAVAYNSTLNSAVCAPFDTDITGPNDYKVTAATYCAIIQDLRPDAMGRSVFSKYWSSADVTRHENFHVDEWRDSLQIRWATFENTVEGPTVPFSCAANSLDSALAQQRGSILSAEITMFKNALADWTALGEEPAYLDGKAGLQALVDGVCSRARAAGWAETNACAVCLP